uniref:Uncharacterized protein n=1 Tax=Anguilla anguilla TaxID=7936 RepID=A0A0E9PAN8_ANGAN
MLHFEKLLSSIAYLDLTSQFFKIFLRMQLSIHRLINFCLPVWDSHYHKKPHVYAN